MPAANHHKERRDRLVTFEFHLCNSVSDFVSPSSYHLREIMPQCMNTEHQLKPKHVFRVPKPVSLFK